MSHNKEQKVSVQHILFTSFLREYLLDDAVKYITATDSGELVVTRYKQDTHEKVSEVIKRDDVSKHAKRLVSELSIALLMPVTDERPHLIVEVDNILFIANHVVFSRDGKTVTFTLYKK